MKTPWFIVGTIVVLALAAFSISERRKNEELRREIARSKEDAASQDAVAKKETAKLQKQIEDRTAVIIQIEEQRKLVASNSAVAMDEPADQAARPRPATIDLKSMVKKMHTDPNMKKAMRSRMMSSVRTMYSDFGKDLGLSAEQATLVMELLGDREMARASDAWGKTKVDGDDSAETSPAEPRGNRVGPTINDYNTPLESFLGKDGMEKLRQYDKTRTDRMQIHRYKQEFVANGTPLNESESEGLLSIMQEERLRPLEQVDLRNVHSWSEGIPSNEELNQKFAVQQAATERRVLERARDVLSPDHLVQFEALQKQQREMREMGIELSRRDQSRK